MSNLFIIFSLVYIVSAYIEITDVTEGLDEDADEMYLTDEFWDRSTIS